MISERLRSLAFFALLWLSGCREALLHDLAELDANRAITRLHAKGVTASKVRQADGMWAIEVDREDAPLAIRVLDEARSLIVSRRKRMEASSIFASREEQLAHTQSLIASEIEQTLMSFNGVLEARVHLSLQPEEPGAPPAARSAGVLVVYAPGSIPSREDIASLVAGASGTALERVSVVFRSAEGVADSEIRVTSSVEGEGQWQSWSAVAASVLLVVGGCCLVATAVRRVRALGRG